MNLNPIDFNYIDGENTYPIQDYIDEKINDLTFDGLYTSNIIINNQKLDNVLYFQTSNLILSNNINLGEIAFKTSFSYPTNTSKAGTIIDYTGKLLVYHNYNILQPTFLEGYYDVEGELLQLKADGINTDGQLTLLEAGAIYLQGEIDTILEAINLIEAQVNAIAGSYGSSLATMEQAIQFTEIQADYAQIMNNIRINSAIQRDQAFIVGSIGAISIGVAGGILSWASSVIYYNYASNSLMNNCNITNNEKNNIYSNNTSNQYSTYSNFNYDLSNLNILNGFINSNIITQQYISLLNVDEIKINQTNISNIISSSSNINYIYSSNNSNLLFNNIGISSNNNYIYSSNSIDKINILLPNSSFWYDANFGGIWCYDLNIEKYVKATILPNNYKYRSFRITTYQSKADWRNGYNLYGANIAGDYINFPETLTIHMNNNKQIGGISTADDTYCNGIILGKTKNTNIGYWNILKDNFNYLRYITKVGWDLICVIEIL